MIKISAHISKKFGPIDGLDFSSQQFSAGMECEVADAEPEALKEKIRSLYRLLAQSVDEQINGAAKKNGNGTPHAPVAPPANGGAATRRLPDATQAATPANGTAATKGRFIPATQSQRKAIFAISKSQGLEMKTVLAERGITSEEQLSVKAASTIIDALKARRKGSQ